MEEAKALDEITELPWLNVDRDNRNRLRLLRTYFNMRYLGLGEPKCFATRGGFHIKLDTTLSIADNMHIREHLGDCRGRLSLDDTKIELGLYSMVDTIWEEKRHYDKRWTKEEPITPLAEPFLVCRIMRKEVRAWRRSGKLQRRKIKRRNGERHR